MYTSMTCLTSTWKEWNKRAMAAKKVPMRMCVGCRQMFPKRELVRVVRNKEGVLSIDKIGKAPGRGAYLCMQAACLERAVKTKGLERALEQKVEPAIYETLRAQLQETQADAQQ